MTGQEDSGNGTNNPDGTTGKKTLNARQKRLIVYGVVTLAVVAVLVAMALLSRHNADQNSDWGQSRGTSTAQDSNAAAGSSGQASSSADAGNGSGSLGAFLSADVKTKAIKESVQALIDQYGGDVSVTYLQVADPDNGFSINGDAQHVSASMIKLLVLATLLDQAAAGQCALSDTLVLTAENAVGGTGVISSTVGSSYTLADLASYMISQSDNAACNMLIDFLGMDSINAEAEKLGLTQTRLERKMLDTEAQAAGLENYMSSNDVARILLLIASGQLVNADSSSFALTLLQNQQIDLGLSIGTGSSVVVAHKTGTLDKVVHDGGIVLAGVPYVLVVMTEGLTVPEAGTLIAGVAQSTFVIMAYGTLDASGNLATVLLPGIPGSAVTLATDDDADSGEYASYADYAAYFGYTGYGTGGTDDWYYDDGSGWTDYSYLYTATGTGTAGTGAVAGPGAASGTAGGGTGTAVVTPVTTPTAPATGTDAGTDAGGGDDGGADAGGADAGGGDADAGEDLPADGGDGGGDATGDGADGAAYVLPDPVVDTGAASSD